jgi:hypothetical protein
MAIGVYNPGPLVEMLQLAKSRRVDIVGVWNSEGAFGAHGFDNALMWALGVDRFGVYATGATSWMEGDGAQGQGHGFDVANSLTGFGILANGSLYTYASSRFFNATANQLQHMDWSSAPTGSYAPVKPLHVEQSAAISTPQPGTGLVLYRRAGYINPIPLDESITFTFWGANWASSPGTLRPVIRNGDSPFTVIHDFNLITYSGTDGTIRKTEHTIAADAARASWEQLQLYSHHNVFIATMVGNLFMTYMRACRATKTNGIAVSPLYSAGSRSAYDMYEALNAVPQETYEHFFEAVCAYQGADTSQHVAIIDVYEGSNLVNETGVSAGAPVPGTPAAAANYVWYMQEIIAKVQNGWVSSGRNASNIAFRVSCSHPITTTADETTLGTYRAALVAGMDFQGTHSNVCVIDRAAITPLAEMQAAGDFQDGVHLNYGGYIRTERKYWNAILGQTSRIDRSGRMLRVSRP